MGRLTKAQLRQMVEELLHLKLSFDRYKALEKEVKTTMRGLQMDEMNVPGAGRVFISASERVNVSPELAIEILGMKLANKVIQIKKSVPNNLIEAFAQAGEISETQHKELLDQAERRPVVSLYVRPLQ